MSAPDTRLKAPKTPLKRISRNSLRAQALSTSQANQPNPNLRSSEPPESFKDPLKSISPLFSDLSDSIQDLHTNLIRLDQVCENLNGFNQSFSSYLYGLRMIYYTTDFDEAPDEIGFKEFKKRKVEIEEMRLKLKLVEDEKKMSNSLDHHRFDQDVSGYEQADQSSTSGIAQNRDYSKPHQPVQSTSHQASGSGSGSRGPSQQPKSFKSQTKAQQKQLLRSTEPIMKTLPIKFREQQPSRSEMEKVICLLFLNPNGLSLKQVVKLDPTLALHRARECVTALVAAKQASKSNEDVSFFWMKILSVS
ncbi:uncharacterized protein MELLADRAFT_103364 [Melampsora larici-populina 98AG31]|uniref:DASH complex subunit DAM1 n=1 Tax=Melampsora larici-populina (strain 98AG31 / pathotype 3-4-7) TaxID=747676 RepID=F4RB82_MELLP|nr:uncharacterized protein MELLADRAFT_103364 [Melampsora larici-populina 98AG31]EGG10035.1 hypothetical protein MELLADRAFT_103364 [Melampsora larici-populina 98AG31]